MPSNQFNTSQRDEVRFDLVEHIGVFGKRNDSGWSREANIVSWNGGAAKVDIRDWDPDHERMSKGVTLYEEEAERLARILCGRYGLRIGSGKEESGEQAKEAEPAVTDEPDGEASEAVCGSREAEDAMSGGAA